LMDEFDRNFQRKAFFDKPWVQTRVPNRRGSLMMRSGRLRKGMRSTVSGTSIAFSNSEPYAELQNNGGQIKVTPKMKRFFWAMYYKANGGSSESKGRKQRELSEEAEWWKRLALKKVGDTITIQQRQFIGWHPEVHRCIERIFNAHLKDVEKYINDKLKGR